MPSIHRQANAAIVDTHASEANIRLTVKTAITVGAWNTTPASAGDLAGSTEKATMRNITALPGKT